MLVQDDYQRRFPRKVLLRSVLVFLIISSLACSLPFMVSHTPTPPPSTSTPTKPPLPTPTPQPLPPGLVESDPPQSVEIPLQGPITLFFNQSMDRNSVEAALRSQLEQELTFTWSDNSTVTIFMSSGLSPETELSLSLGDEVLSSQGKSLMQPISLNYRTANYLRLLQVLPEKDSVDIDPTSAIVAAFNQPVVPLGADSNTLPPAFTLEPAAKGEGKWINTSTYIFYPDPSLDGGQLYAVRINPGLKSTLGSPLQDAQDWSFTTSTPKLLSLSPDTEIPWPLDAKVILTFNQPMDPDSVAANFSLVDSNGNLISGSSSWDEDLTVFNYTPTNLLPRNAMLKITLDGQSKARGGTPLGSSYDSEVVTVPNLAVSHTDPAPGGSIDPEGNVVLYFTTPIMEKDVKKHVSIEPAVSDFGVSEEGSALRLYGFFVPNTTYTVKVSPGLSDPWGGTLGQEYQYTFIVNSWPPNIQILSTGGALFVTTEDSSLNAQAVNISSIPLSLGSVPLNDFLAMLGPQGYELLQTYQSPDQRSWSQPVILEPDQVQFTEIFLSPDDASLDPGLYIMRLEASQSDELREANISTSPYLIVSSNLQVTFKISPSDALVWLMDMQDYLPVSNTPVIIYDYDGSVLAAGQTDVEGIFRATFDPRKDPYQPAFAVIGQAGQDDFGMGISFWSTGIEPWDFNIPSSSESPGLKVYFYTDRPIYRPGQTVNFRAVARKAFNGRYSPPDIASLPLMVTGNEGQILTELDLPLTSFGTTHGEFSLSDTAQPGYYQITTSEDQQAILGFQVANYRKPEINLQVSFSEDQVQAGQVISALVNARYFFEAPASNVPIHWALYSKDTYFNLPGYRVGPVDTDWLEAFRYPDFFGSLGKSVSEGDSQTGTEGTLELEFPTELNDTRQLYTLEVTALDESGLPVSARASVITNPDLYYIGVHPDTWVGRSGEQVGFDVQIVDWEKETAPAQKLRAEFKKVVWIRQDPPLGDPAGLPQYTPEYTEIGSTDFATSEEGKARLAFTPPEPGTFMLDVSNAEVAPGSGAHTQLILWIGGSGQATWPSLPNSRLRLTSDKDDYLAGEEANVFIPNPFGKEVQALLTLERGIVMEYKVISVPPGGFELNLPLTSEHAPNVFLSATLIGKDEQGKPDFRQGLIELAVEPIEQTLKVTLVSQPEQAEPGDQVNFDIQVTDSKGNPVQGEFSLAVVDLAALALADPNSVDIVEAFYGKQPDAVHTSLSLAAYTHRLLHFPGGFGGGGGEEAPSVVREKFPDTALWNAEVITGSDGKAQVSMVLPDTLTTWHAEARGITVDTLVGQAKSLMVTSKDVLIRPVTPRFFVEGDRSQLAAVVQNNTNDEIQAEVSLQANGFAIDQASSLTQQISIPAQGRTRLEWWGTVQNVESVDLVFTVQGKELVLGSFYQDSARPTWGTLPVLRYASPQTFRTSGTMDEAGEIQELVSLPQSYEVNGGDLNLELASTLAGSMLKALEVLEHAPCESTEQILSSFLPNLETYRTLRDFGIDDPSLKAGLDRTLNDGLSRLQSRQSYEGGWPWWQNGESDTYISSYVLFGLSRAQLAGININEEVIRRAVDYLRETSPIPPTGANLPPKFTAALGPPQEGSNGWPSETWEFDQLVFRQFALDTQKSADLSTVDALYQYRERLSPWAKALLALTMENLSPGNKESATLFSEIQTASIRSATGAFWEFSQDQAGQLAAMLNMHTTLSNSAIVLYSLAQRDPDSPLSVDVMRYLMASRDAEGAWHTTYTSAWSLMALNQVMKATSELSGDFAYSAVLNQYIISEGKASVEEGLTPITAQVSTQKLYPDYPNLLQIQREEGSGRLYYTASLEVFRSVEEVSTLSQGLSVERAFYSSEETCLEENCSPIQEANNSEKVVARLTLDLPNDVYYLAVTDYIPAGAEILDTSLKTTQVGESGEPEAIQQYNPRDPFQDGWGWWLFNPSQIFDDHILWTANFLPAGTYQLTYTLVLYQPGEYKVLPARAWQLYFPDVQANSAGTTFRINP